METANKCCCCCFEYPLKFLFKSSYKKCLYISVFAKFSYLQRNPVIKIFKTKKKSLYHPGNFNSPFPLQPPRLRPGLRSNVIVCAVLNSVADQCRSSNKLPSTQYVRIGESNRSVERHFTVNSAACHLTGIRLER